MPKLPKRDQAIKEISKATGIEVRKIPRFTWYAASADGRIWDLNTVEAVPPYVGKSGYEGVWLRQGKKRPKYHMVHKLMANTFLGTKPAPKLLVRHLNGNCHDNSAANLKWGTAAENAADRVEHSKAYNKLTPRQKTNITKKVTQETRHELAKQYNVSFHTINNLWKKK